MLSWRFETGDHNKGKGETHMKLKQLAQRTSSKKEAKETSFECFAPTAKRVSLAGTFNNWNTGACALRKDRNGNWHATLSLKPGRYEYLFFVDGAWQCDPHIKECVPNSFGTQNCVITVQ